jgi:hypothetical protein
VIPESNTGPKDNRKIVLVIIAIYGTVQIFLKSILAIYYHMKWVFSDCRCCRKPLFPERLNKVNDLWKKLNNDYMNAISQ